MDEPEFKQVLDGVTGELGRRQRALSQPQLRLHHMIVRHFADTAQAPSPAELRSWADELGIELAGALAELAALDLTECDADRALVQGAYPFTGHAAGYQAQIAGGATVESYCALDSLGISAMLGRDVHGDVYRPPDRRAGPRRSPRAGGQLAPERCSPHDAFQFRRRGPGRPGLLPDGQLLRPACQRPRLPA